MSGRARGRERLAPVSVVVERVVLLGATGFIGRALHGELQGAGVEVIAHGSKTLDLRQPDVVERELHRVAAPTTTLVLAAALTPDKGQTLATFAANLAMATNVAQSLDRYPVGRCVYLSTDAIYGFDFDPIDETTPVAPSGYYALAKYTAEHILKFVTSTRGIPLLSIRLAGSFGPGDPHASYGPSAFARSLAKDRTVHVFGAGEERRDHLYVSDAARLVAALIPTSETGVINVATGTTRSFADVVAIIRGLVRYDFETVTVARKGSITHRQFDTARLRAAVPGFCFTPFEDALRATLTEFGAI
jgi:UDP-glucose 4-epimerase